MRAIRNRVNILRMAICCCLCMAACSKGNENPEGTNAEVPGSGEYAYIPQYVEINPAEETGGEKIYFGSAMLNTDGFLYTYNVYSDKVDTYIQYRDFDNISELQGISTDLLQASGKAFVDRCFSDHEGNLYFVWDDVINEEGDSICYLSKFTKQFLPVYKITLDDIWVDKWNNYIQSAVVDRDGYVYGFSQSVIYKLGPGGTLEKTIQSKNADNVFCLEDGRIFISYYGNAGLKLAEFDRESETFGKPCENLPELSSYIWPGTNGKVLICNSMKLYEYDLEKGESTELLNWLDVDISGPEVCKACVTKDGGIAVLCSQAESDFFQPLYELVLLSKVDKALVTTKEIITLATIESPEEPLINAVVKFNKSSSRYRVEIKTYMDEDATWSYDNLTDAVNRFQADLVAGNGADLIYLNRLDWANLADKGVLEDLAPYIQREGGIEKEDFLEAIVKSYERGGKIYTLPRGFSLSTLMGKEALVGTTQGWTFEDMVKLAEGYPEMTVIQGIDIYSFIKLYVQYGEGSFVDYQSGKCNFDSPEFVELLEFVGQNPRFMASDFSVYTNIMLDKVLLTSVNISSLENFQMCRLLFKGEGNFIGYPTMNGTSGVFLEGEQMLAMSAGSKNKEGAWAFLETYLSGKNDAFWQMPTLVTDFEEDVAEAMRIEYQYDEQGNILYDEAGNPMQEEKMQYGYYDLNGSIYAATEEEIEDFYRLLSRAVGGSTESEIAQIVVEEIAPFLNGQKNAEEVAAIIQSRAQLYLDENQ